VEAGLSFDGKHSAIKHTRLSTKLSLFDKGFRDRDVRDIKAMAKSPKINQSWKKRAEHQRFEADCARIIHL
jgi:primosomal protein N''